MSLYKAFAFSLFTSNKALTKATTFSLLKERKDTDKCKYIIITNLLFINNNSMLLIIRCFKHR